MMRPINFRRMGITMAALAILGGVTGCTTAASARKFKTGDSPQLPPPQVITLSAGDQVEVKFYYSADLNEVQTIRPDGKITLQLVGDVMAAGLTPAELTVSLKALYVQRIEHPEVAVLVREQAERAVYVTGAVNRPGRIGLPGNLTAFGAISRAGGFDFNTAGPSDVVVIRQTDGVHRGWRVNLDDLLAGQSQTPFYLQPSDIVHVPQSKITNLNHWMEQYINRMIPQLGIRYTRVSGDTAVTVDTTDNRR
jgi:polysaccharide export outer membrane protein